MFYMCWFFERNNFSNLQLQAAAKALFVGTDWTKQAEVISLFPGYMQEVCLIFSIVGTQFFHFVHHHSNSLCFGPQIVITANQTAKDEECFKKHFD